MEVLSENNKGIPHLKVWLMAGLLVWVSISVQRETDWVIFSRNLLAICIAQLPVFVFVWKEDALRQRLSRRTYIICWLLTFMLAMPVFTAICIRIGFRGVQSHVFTTTLIFSLLLEVLQVLDTSYRQRIRYVNWVKRISLDSAVLISLLLIAITLSAMAVSSLDNPIYHTKEQLLIGYEFSPYKVITRFGDFLGFVIQFLFMYLCGYLLYYINSRVLVASILKKRGIISYVLSALAVMAILYPILGQLLAWLPVNHLLGGIFSDNPFVYENAFGAFIILFSTLPVVLAIQWTRQNNRIVALEKEKTRTELDLLRQQLNPHFFFNTLNNLYALSLQQSPQTPESILQLSELMRYVIYKGQEAQVNIREEVRYIEDYIQLQQIRLQKRLDLQINCDITDHAIQVPPMLLIVLVENAFKHGIEPAEETAFLHMQLHCDQRQLYFSCENSFEQATANSAGIGLANLERRLSLLYPGHYTLKTGIKNHTFKAEMQLDLT